MRATLPLADEQDVADVETFVRRARVVDPAGAIRIQASADLLALTVAVLPGAGLLGTGAVLGMRALRLAGPAYLDEVVGLDAVADRLARLRDGGGTALPVPPVPVAAAWTGVSPPRVGWNPIGSVTADEVTRTAQEGLAEIAAAASDNAVADLRRRVWSREFGQDAATAPAGLAFGAHVLGFVTQEAGRLFRNGPWVRLGTSAGQVLTR